MPTSYVKFVRCLNVTKRLLAALLLLSFTLSPVIPAVRVFAQEVGQENSNQEAEAPVQDEVVPEDNGSSQGDEVIPPPSSETTEPEQEETPAEDPAPIPKEEAVEVPPKVVAPVEEVPIPKTKFKKDNSLSVEEQLAKVRQHLIDNKLPQTALDRLSDFEAALAIKPEKENALDKIANFIKNDSSTDKEKKDAERIIKAKPFQVETFEGKINTADADRYKHDFSEAKEQGNTIQKIKNILQNGTSFNSNFDKTKSEGGLLSWLFGPSKAVALVSDDPDDYLADGEEIVFSQAIQDQADALGNDPLKILNFVKNKVEYIPYYGSKKGADATLVELAGNDMDQASLLIAMLRHSNIPARYRHVDAKMDLDTVNRLFGTSSAIAAAQIMSLEKIPYILYTLNGDPYFFVIEHTYVEAYIPYGVSRGADITDGGESQWVPMDPSINTYGYSQIVDIVGEMNADGFNIEDFFDDYLQGDYNTLEPLEAYKEEVEDYLATATFPEYPNLTYDEVIVSSNHDETDLEIIPGSLPFEISADLNTYDYIPSSLRHAIEFTVTDTTEVLNHSAYVSDLADNEILVTYEAATQNDQDIIDGFDTIYDVVPLSLVAVKPALKIKGETAALGTASVTLGKELEYTMEFSSPRRTMGSSVTTASDKIIDKDIIMGNTDAIALNTDRVVPLEVRPEEDTQTASYMADQMLYRTAVDYLDRLQYTHGELANITGGKFTNTASRTAIFNGIEVTNSNGQPYSFDWKGLRIDAYSKVRYYHNFSETITTNRKEFMAVFGLQASQDESDIFEDNFGVESVATVKGLKLVSEAEFPGVTLEKITDANEGDIDSLSISSGLKTVFHDAIGNGNIIYTPSDSITYGEWEGLFYIAIDFEGGDSTFAIGEGLNGGFSICALPGITAICNWNGNIVNLLVPKAYASGYNAVITAPSTSFVNQVFNAVIQIKQGATTLFSKVFSFLPKKTGSVEIIAGSGTTQTATVEVTPPSNPLEIVNRIYPACGPDKGNCTSLNRKAEDITQIVLHFTIGGSVEGTIEHFNKKSTLGTSGTSAHYVVDRDGTIYQIVKDKDKAWHAGSRGVAGDYLAHKKTIGIEIANYGPLTYSAGVYRIAEVQGQPVFTPRTNQLVYDNGVAWGIPTKEYRYWEDAYPQQAQALENLIDELVDKYDVQKVVFEQNSQPNIIDFEDTGSTVTSFNGILGHSVIADYKIDPGPAWQEKLFNLLGL